MLLLFLYHLKISNIWFFDVFKGLEQTSGMKWFRKSYSQSFPVQQFIESNRNICIPFHQCMLFTQGDRSIYSFEVNNVPPYLHRLMSINLSAVHQVCL